MRFFGLTITKAAPNESDGLSQLGDDQTRSNARSDGLGLGIADPEVARSLVGRSEVGERADRAERRADAAHDRLDKHDAQLRECLDRTDELTRTGRRLSEEWDDTLARIAKITGKLAAQARRDLAKSSEQAESLQLVPDDMAPQRGPLTKEQLRKLANR